MSFNVSSTAALKTKNNGGYDGNSSIKNPADASFLSSKGGGQGVDATSKKQLRFQDDSLSKELQDRSFNDRSRTIVQPPRSDSQYSFQNPRRSDSDAGNRDRNGMQSFNRFSNAQPPLFSGSNSNPAGFFGNANAQQQQPFRLKQNPYQDEQMSAFVENFLLGGLSNPTAHHPPPPPPPMYQQQPMPMPMIQQQQFSQPVYQQQQQHPMNNFNYYNNNENQAGMQLRNAASKALLQQGVVHSQQQQNNNIVPKQNGGDGNQDNSVLLKVLEQNQVLMEALLKEKTKKNEDSPSKRKKNRRDDSPVREPPDQPISSRRQANNNNNNNNLNDRNTYQHSSANNNNIPQMQTQQQQQYPQNNQQYQGNNSHNNYPQDQQSGPPQYIPLDMNSMPPNFPPTRMNNQGIGMQQPPNFNSQQYKTGVESQRRVFSQQGGAGFPNTFEEGGIRYSNQPGPAQERSNTSGGIPSRMFSAPINGLPFSSPNPIESQKSNYNFNDESRDYSNEWSSKKEPSRGYAAGQSSSNSEFHPKDVSTMEMFDRMKSGNHHHRTIEPKKQQLSPIREFNASHMQDGRDEYSTKKLNYKEGNDDTSNAYSTTTRKRTQQQQQQQSLGMSSWEDEGESIKKLQSVTVPSIVKEDVPAPVLKYIEKRKEYGVPDSASLAAIFRQQQINSRGVGAFPH